MPNHKSSDKRVRQTATRRLRNRYYAKTARNAVRRLREMKADKAAAAEAYNKVSSMLDRLARKNVISNRGVPAVQDGPFVYRLGRKIFILERGVRFSYGLRDKHQSSRLMLCLLCVAGRQDVSAFRRAVPAFSRRLAAYRRRMMPDTRELGRTMNFIMCPKCFGVSGYFKNFPKCRHELYLRNLR